MPASSIACAATADVSPLCVARPPRRRSSSSSRFFSPDDGGALMRRSGSSPAIELGASFPGLARFLSAPRHHLAVSGKGRSASSPKERGDVARRRRRPASSSSSPVVVAPRPVVFRYRTFNLPSRREYNSERSLRGGWGTPSGDDRGIGPMAASCSAVSDASFIFIFPRNGKRCETNERRI